MSTCRYVATHIPIGFFLEGEEDCSIESNRGLTVASLFEPLVIENLISLSRPGSVIGW